MSGVAGATLTKQINLFKDYLHQSEIEISPYLTVGNMAVLHIENLQIPARSDLL